MARPSALGKRIANILDGRPRFTLSRPTEVLLACSGVLVLLLCACTYLTARTAYRIPSRQKVDGAISVSQRKSLEERIGSNPDDIDARSQLLRAGLFTDETAQIVAQYLCLAEHRPALTQLQRSNQSSLVLQALLRTSNYDHVLALWREIGDHSQSGQALLNAASFQQQRDAVRAEVVYRRAELLAPNDEHVTSAWGQFLAVAAERSLAYQAHRNRRYWQPIDFGKLQALRLREELESSPNPLLLASAAEYLTAQQSSGMGVFRGDDDVRQFGFKLFERARKLDPNNDRSSELQKRAEVVQPLHGPGHIIWSIAVIPTVALTQSQLTDHALRMPSAFASGLARILHMQGDVTLKVRISDMGVVRSASVTSGKWLLRADAARAMEAWRFAPVYRDGYATEIESAVTVPVTLPR